jgi:hypothetical protein
MLWHQLISCLRSFVHQIFIDSKPYGIRPAKEIPFFLYDAVKADQLHRCQANLRNKRIYHSHFLYRFLHLIFAAQTQQASCFFLVNCTLIFVQRFHVTANTWLGYVGHLITI